MFTLEHEANETTSMATRSFKWSEISIRNTEFRANKVFLIKDADNHQSSLEVYAKLGVSERAGVKIVLYVHNVVINNTDQKLMIYYDKKTAAAGQISASDNSIIPLSNVSLIYSNYNLASKSNSLH